MILHRRLGACASCLDGAAPFRRPFDRRRRVRADEVERLQDHVVGHILAGDAFDDGLDLAEVFGGAGGAGIDK